MDSHGGGSDVCRDVKVRKPQILRQEIKQTVINSVGYWFGKTYIMQNQKFIKSYTKNSVFLRDIYI